MKLHPADLSLRYHRSISGAVIRLADDHRRVIRFTVEGVDEVEERFICYAVQQRVGARLPDLISGATESPVTRKGVITKARTGATTATAMRAQRAKRLARRTNQFGRVAVFIVVKFRGYLTGGRVICSD